MADTHPVHVTMYISPPWPFTRRQSEIVALIAAEMSNKEIADHLGISAQTVKTHITNMMRATGARSRVGLVLRAIILEGLKIDARTRATKKPGQEF